MFSLLLQLNNLTSPSIHIDTALTKDEMADKLGFTKVVIIECLNIWTKSKVLKLAADGRYSLY